jgi:spore coat polysaccharide biosynthesis predicted glycosyltransferase SpsG
VVLDGYHLDPELGAALRGQRQVVLAIVDGEHGSGQDADIYLDQNLDAEREHPDALGARRTATHLRGLQYVLFRDSVVSRSPGVAVPPAKPHASAVPRVVAIFGGTDSFGAGRVVIPLVMSTPAPMTLEVVTSDPSLAAAVTQWVPGPGQLAIARAPVADLAGAVAGCDLVITAAGSTVWEMLCIGVPLAVVAVADNQEIGYLALANRHLAVPLGRLADIRQSDVMRRRAVNLLTARLRSPQGLRDQALRGRRLVDGQGRARVAEVLMSAIAQGPHSRTPAVHIAAAD